MTKREKFEYLAAAGHIGSDIARLLSISPQYVSLLKTRHGVQVKPHNDRELKLIYVAAPYSHESQEVRDKRAHIIFRYTEFLMASDLVAFSPITYGRVFEEAGHKSDFNTWKEFNKTILYASTHVHILCLPGWKNSVGVRQENRWAEQLRKPVVAMSFEDILSRIGESK